MKLRFRLVEAFVQLFVIAEQLAVLPGLAAQPPVAGEVLSALGQVVQALRLPVAVLAGGTARGRGWARACTCCACAPWKGRCKPASCASA